MSTENPALTNFDGLEGLERLASAMRLDVRTRLDAAMTTLEPGESIRFPSHDLRDTGMTLRSPWVDLDVPGALADAHLDATDVEVMVLAENAFLKDRCFLTPPTPMNVWDHAVKLLSHGEDRPDAALDTLHGFTLEAVLVLAHELPLAPLRPHRRGTILARSVFKVRPTRDIGGLDPEPLTPEIISEHHLSDKSTLFVLCDGDLLTMDSFVGNLRIFVHQALLAEASRQRGPTRDAIVTGLAVEALCQLSYAASAALGADEEPGEDAVVFRVLRNNLAAAGWKLDPDAFVEQLRTNPAVVAARLSGLDQRAARLTLTLVGEEEPG